MRRKKTQEEYVGEVATINPNLEVLGKYIDSRTPLLHRCKIDGHQWNPFPGSILRGHGCPICRNRKLREQRVKSQEQYEEEVAQLHPTIKVIGVYVNTETPILHKCLLDDYEWMPKPGNILNGKGCPKCAGNVKFTHEEYVKKLNQLNPNVIVLEKYVNATTPIKHKCLLDNHIWSTQPFLLLHGCGCPKCAGNIRKTLEEYMLELSMINPDIEVLEDYVDAKTPILHQCKIDGFQWHTSPSNILNGTGCPHCQQSKGEKYIAKWLESRNINYVYQKKFSTCLDKKQLPFDFYLPEFNLCIEYDGVQHFKPIDFANKGEEWAIEQFHIVQYHDSIKNQYCEDNNIYLLRIPYFKDIDEELQKFLFILI